MSMRVGFDIGGTFTDVIAFEGDGSVRTAKILSHLDQIGGSISEFVSREGRGEVDTFVHGTTQASNAVIESQAARTGLLTTRGFRDILEIRNLRRPNIFDLNWDRPPAYIPRRLRLEVDERILADGSVACELDVTVARAAIQALLDEKVEAIAVCLINSYRNPTHEQRLGALLAEMAPHIPVSLSSEVRPEIREYERTSTTAVNASLTPVIGRYLGKLETALKRHSSRFLVMQSNGGLMTSDVARARPFLMVESGPAAGVLAAARLAEECKLRRVLSVDMGGTTAKACLIEDFAPLEKPHAEIGVEANAAGRGYTGSGHAVSAPSLDLVEVGAGGGSIAWVDNAGVLRLGPRSAGAEPGPACYGRGGTEPTVTDANVALGYMNPDAIAASTLKVDKAAAVAAIQTRLCGKLQRNVEDVAYAIIQLACATMMRAVRAVSTERGRDPREFTMLAFGGAGPMHAAALAESIGVRHVVVPVYPGLYSALGLLLADYRLDFVTSLAEPVDRIDHARVVFEFDKLEQRAREQMQAQGVTASVQLHRQADLKYGHQLSELATTVSPDELGAGLPALLAERFHTAHERAFGYRSPQESIELVSLRLRATAQASTIGFSDLAGKAAAPRTNGSPTRKCYFGAHGFVEARVAARGDLSGVVQGPLILDEPDTTIVVPPGWTAERDDFGSVHLRYRSEGR